MEGISWMKNIGHEETNEQILPKYHRSEPVVQCLMTNLLKTLNVYNFSLKMCQWCYSVKDSSYDDITHFLHILMNCKIFHILESCASIVSPTFYSENTISFHMPGYPWSALLSSCSAWEKVLPVIEANV